MKRICVFCGANTGSRPAFREAAARLGGLLGQRGLGLVYGGGAVGLMGVVADSALAAGAEVIGVIPEALSAREIAHAGLSRLEVVATMHARKARMVQLADAFVALPGGFGTLDELFEVLTWAQLGLHDKPIGLLDVGGYFQPLLRFIENSVAEALLRREHADLVRVAVEPDFLLTALASRPPRRPVRKWITEADT